MSLRDEIDGRRRRASRIKSSPGELAIEDRTNAALDDYASQLGITLDRALTDSWLRAFEFIPTNSDAVFGSLLRPGDEGFSDQLTSMFGAVMTVLIKRLEAMADAPHP